MVEEGAEVVVVVNDVLVAEDNILAVVDETEVAVLGGVVLEVAEEVEVEADVVKGADVVVVEINVEAAVAASFVVMAGMLVATDVVLVDVAGGAPSVVEETKILMASATLVVRDAVVVAGANMAVAAVVMAELVVTDCLVEEGKEMVVAAGELE